MALDTTHDRGTPEVLDSYLDALVAGDAGSIRDHFAADATWWIHGDLPISGTLRGADRILDFLRSAGTLFVPGTQRYEFGTVTAEADRAVLEWRVQGRSAATGLDYDNSYCAVFVVRDGVIHEVREYLDSLHAQHVLFGAPAAAS
jgi:hypothetical protein